MNPEKLLEGLDESNFGKLSLRRNEILADVFARTPYVEKYNKTQLKQIFKKK